MKATFTLLTGVSLAALANAHGYFTSPEARQPGPAFKAACGLTAFNQLNSDINGNIQNLEQNTQGHADFNPALCNLWQCKGLQYADNTANVQHFTPGQVVPLQFNIRAPHTGSANVSIVSTCGNSIIFSNLVYFPDYASTSTPIPANQTSFSVTIPTTLGSQCAAPGVCVIQMYWDSPSTQQTYESCIDFVVPSAAAKRDHARNFAIRET